MGTDSVKCVGWEGAITAVEPKGNKVLVTVWVQSRLVSSYGGPAFTYENVIETWEYADGKLKYITGKSGPAPNTLLFLD
jgi:hypothetical protein